MVVVSYSENNINPLFFAQIVCVFALFVLRDAPTRLESLHLVAFGWYKLGGLGRWWVKNRNSLFCSSGLVRSGAADSCPHSISHARIARRLVQSVVSESGVSGVSVAEGTTVVSSAAEVSCRGLNGALVQID